jgi:hypothetical protein
MISPARVAQLDLGEQVIKELRRRLITELLTGPEAGTDLKTTLARLIAEVSSEKVK